MTRNANINRRRLRTSVSRVRVLARRVKWLRTFQVLAVTAGLLCGARHVTAQSAPSETQLKAAFLVNFPKYVEWAAETAVQTNGPVVVATWGETNLGEELRKMTQGKTINGRLVVFKILEENDNVADSHVLFIPDSARRRVPALLEKLKGSSVLTVGESDDFLEKGGMINLARRDRKVRLEINLVSSRQANLKISSKLLSVADVVKGK